MKNLLIFPYNRETESIVESVSSDLNKKYRILGIIGQENEVYVLKDNRLVGKERIENIIHEVDTLLLVNNIQGLSIEGYLNKIKWAKRNNWHVIMSKQLAKQLDIKALEEIEILENAACMQRRQICFEEITTPIITIMGEGENCDKFALQIKLAEAFKENGYDVALISSNSLAKVLEWNSLPNFLFDDGISYNVKINMFRNYIHEYERERKADIIIIGCPSGIMKLNDYQENYQGELPMVITNAINVDIGILCIYDAPVNEEYFDKLSSYCLYRFGVKVNKFYISQQQYRNNRETKKVEYLFLGSPYYLDKAIDSIGKKYRLYSLNDICTMAAEIIAELSGNLEAI